MKEMLFTPGSLVAMGATITTKRTEGGGGFAIGRAWTRLRLNLQEADANARLWAAAPEMYASLQECATVLNRMWERREFEDVELVNRAEAALARARGVETPDATEREQS